MKPIKTEIAEFGSLQKYSKSMSFYYSKITGSILASFQQLLRKQQGLKYILKLISFLIDKRIFTVTRLGNFYFYFIKLENFYIKIFSKLNFFSFSCKN